MSLVTVSTKRDRVYQRAFDHEEAQRLRAEGQTYKQIADAMGVSAGAVHRVCDPLERERMHQAALAWQYKHYRKPCINGCGRLAWHHAGRSGVCIECQSEQRAAEARERNERPSELRCQKCGEWKPDAEFGTAKHTRRRGHRDMCRECDTARRRAHRAANREREHTTDNNRKRRDKRMSSFVVLKQTAPGQWVEAGTVDAVSRLHAVERIADGEGDWTAVTAKSLEPMRVAPTTAFRVVRDA